MEHTYRKYDAEECLDDEFVGRLTTLGVFDGGRS